MRRRSQVSRCTMLLAGVLVGVGLMGCDSGGSHLVRPSAAETMHVSEAALQNIGLQYYWHASHQVPLAPGESVDRILLLDENLYVITNTSSLIALDASVGTQRWRKTVSLQGRPVYTPSHADNVRLREDVWTDTVAQPPDASQFPPRNVVVVNDLTHALVLDRATGETCRDLKFSQATATGAGTCDTRYYYYPGLPDTLYCIDLMVGQAIWWLRYDGISNVPVRQTAGVAYVGTTEGQMKSFDIGQVGLRKWQLDFDGPILSPFHVDARGLFFGAGQQIHARHPSSGLTLWEPVHVNGPIEAPMQVSDTTLYQYVEDDGLYAINISNGEVRWKQPSGRTVVAVMDGRAYVVDADETLNVTNEITGDIEATVPMSGFDFFVPNTTAPAIYAATARGSLYCIRKTDAGRLTAEMLLQK